MKRFVVMGLTVLGLLGLWAVYLVPVVSCLPEGSTAWLLTADDERLDVARRTDSEVDTEQNWFFPLPKDGPPVRLVVRAGGAGGLTPRVALWEAKT